MKIRSLCAAVFLSLLPTGAIKAEGACGCPDVPLAGSYRAGGENVRIDYIEPAEAGIENCSGLRLRLRVPRRDARDADVVLRCVNGTWEGDEPVPELMGRKTWRLKSTPGGAATALSLNDSMLIELELPQMLLGLGKQNRTIPMAPMTPVKLGKAPACLCNFVKAERDFAKKRIKAYEDNALRACAKAMHLRGKSNGANFYLDNADRLKQFDALPQANYSYEDLVRLSVSRGATCDNGKITIPPVAGQSAPSPKVAQVANQAGGAAGRPQVGAEASVHPVTCAITMPTPAAIRKECKPAIFLSALRKHEEVHQRQCRASKDQQGNDVKVLKPGDSEERIDLTQRDATGSLFINGRNAPNSAYDAWSQNPDNQALDESAAYRAEVDIYDAWLNTYCPGAFDPRSLRK